jgi:hypothetical protein
MDGQMDGQTVQPVYMFTASLSARPARSTSRQPEGSSRRRHGTWRRLSPRPRSTRTANRTPECPRKPHMRRTARYSLGGSQEKTATRYGRRRSIRHDRMHPTARNTVEQTPARSVCSRPSHHLASHPIPSCIGYQRRRSAREDQAEWMPRHAHGHAHAPEPLLVRPPGTFPLPAASCQLQPALTRRWAPGP